MANFRQKKIRCRAMITKKWINPVAKLRNKNSLTRGVASSLFGKSLILKNQLKTKMSVRPVCWVYVNNSSA